MRSYPAYGRFAGQFPTEYTSGRRRTGRHIMRIRRVPFATWDHLQSQTIVSRCRAMQCPFNEMALEFPRRQMNTGRLSQY